MGDIRRLKRLRKELINLNKEPINGISVQPREDNFALWDCYIHMSLDNAARPKKNSKAPPTTGTTNQHDGRSFPAHMLFSFPAQYPIEAPFVGFSTKFRYKGGANMPGKGQMEGYWVICMDMLGNFANVHGDWQAQSGRGWSPAYTVSSLLINIQSVLYDSIQNSSHSENEQYRLACIAYATKNNIPLDVAVAPAAAAAAPAEEVMIKNSTGITTTITSATAGSTATTEEAPAAAADSDNDSKNNSGVDGSSSSSGVTGSRRVAIEDELERGLGKVGEESGAAQRNGVAVAATQNVLAPPAAPRPSFLRRVFGCTYR